MKPLRLLGHQSIEIDCVDQDAQAINYAKGLCRDFLAHIQIYTQKYLSFHTDQNLSPDLVCRFI